MRQCSLDQDDQFLNFFFPLKNKNSSWGPAIFFCFSVCARVCVFNWIDIWLDAVRLNKNKTHLIAEDLFFSILDMGAEEPIWELCIAIFQKELKKNRLPFSQVALRVGIVSKGGVLFQSAGRKSGGNQFGAKARVSHFDNVTVSCHCWFVSKLLEQRRLCPFKFWNDVLKFPAEFHPPPTAPLIGPPVYLLSSFLFSN